MRKSKDFDLEFSPLIPKKPLFFLPLRNTFFLYIILSSPYLPSDILREIYDMNAYLKLICLTLGSPFSLHHVKENDYLITAMYIYTLTKTEPSMSKPVYSFVQENLLFKKESLLCLGSILLCTYNCVFFIVKRNFMISAVQVIKIISRSFSLFVFRKTSNIKTNYKAVYKIFSLQILQLEKLENKNTMALTLRFLP